MSSRYAVGIDLGTTNSVLSWLELNATEPIAEVMGIPQLVDRGTVEERSSLPSFTYLATEDEAMGGACDLPWCQGADYAVGEYARRRSADNPDRTIGGAKSWLCHRGVDRRARILPWNAPEGIPQISPVDATQRYLEHLVEAWDNRHPDHPIAEQQVVLTVPASFDPAARDLTLEAASRAGLPEDLVLLEEPQAAVYAWLARTGDDWRKHLTAGQSLLIVDVGGGTTDLTLIDAVDEDGDLTLRRRAVGDHLLLGGDNMDLAIAHHASALFAEQGTDLDPWQSVALWHSCRAAKEQMLDDGGPESVSVSVLGRGSRLIGGTVTAELNRKDVLEQLTAGFLPECPLERRPAAGAVAGFQELGLPYEQDPAITRHIAEFLLRQADAGNESGPDRILLNGGVFRSPLLSDQLVRTISGWYPAESRPELLGGEQNLDHAVSLGAAAYGWIRHNGAPRIRGGTARSWYVGIETAGLAVPGAPRPLHALCVVPQGMEEGTECSVDARPIGLALGTTVRFPFFGSAVRPDDQPGTRLTRWGKDELQESQPVEAELPRQEDDDRLVPVTFQSRVTELGVLELWCVQAGADRRWKLEFNVRDKDDSQQQTPPEQE